MAPSGRTWLVGVDGSRHSSACIQLVGSLLGGCSDRVEVLHLRDPGAGDAPSHQLLDQSERACVNEAACSV